MSFALLCKIKEQDNLPCSDVVAGVLSLYKGKANGSLREVCRLRPRKGRSKSKQARLLSGLLQRASCPDVVAGVVNQPNRNIKSVRNFLTLFYYFKSLYVSTTPISTTTLL